MIGTLRGRNHTAALVTPSRFRVALGIVMGTLALAAAPQAMGQAPAPAAVPARPDFQVLRYNENWTVVRNRPNPTAIDQLKHIPLADSGAVYVSFGGQLRTRAEGVNNFMLLDTPDRSDSFGLVRALLHGDLHAGQHLRVFVEGKEAVAYSRDLPGKRRPLDQDTWELQNAFADVAFGAAADPIAVTARAGRQELLLGSQRLVSPLDWTNTRRTFEGARLMTRVKKVMIDGFATRPVLIDTVARNTGMKKTYFMGASIRPTVAAARFAWELYATGLLEDSVRLWGRDGEHNRYTVGGRLTGTLGSAANRFDLEGGVQKGTLAAEDVTAWFLASDISRTFSALGMRPVATVGFDYSSGDSDPTDGVAETFHQLFPLGHAYLGYMDLLGRQNVIEGRAVLTASPIPAIQTRAAVHHFLRSSTSDAIYGVGGGVFRPSSNDRRPIGTEFDVTASFRANRHSRLEIGYGRFEPAGFLTAATGGAVASDWVYASTSFTF